MSRMPISESELHAYVDNALTEARRFEVDAYLANHAEDAERVSAYRRQKEALHAEFDAVAAEAVPERLRVRSMRRERHWLRYGIAAAWLAVGVGVGWQLNAYYSGHRMESAALPQRAAIAHVVYSPEVRHPVEVGADQQAHLVAWLSKRLDTKLKVPILGAVGYTLVGGRLLPGDRGPAAQFMYQDAKGQRLTLYVRRNKDDSGETAFRFAQEGKVGVFYWIDGTLGYALSGEVSKAELLRVCTAVYRQLNP